VQKICAGYTAAVQLPDKIKEENGRTGYLID
jgi:hypothetical protein